LSLLSGQRDLVTRKFYIVIAMFIVITLSLVALDRFQAGVLDAVRAYVAGEGFWSKGQKDASFHLEHYGEGFDPQEFMMFHKGLEPSLGDRKARLALQSDPPDLEKAREGFLEGRNHADDIDGMIFLFINFGEVSYMKKAIAIWTEGDGLIDELIDLASAIDAEVRAEKPDREKIRRLLDQADQVSTRLSELEDRFSSTLGDAARWIRDLTGNLMIGTALILLMIGTALSRQIIHGIRQTQSELKKMEEQLRHTQKMEAVGTLIGGIAHDFNNSLAAMKGNIYLAQTYSEGSDARLREKLQNLDSLNDHSAEMVRQLMTFASKDIVRKRPLSLNALIRSHQRLTSSILPENISLNLQLCDDDLWIHGDETQLQQVFLNLLKNAVDAVESVASPEISITLSWFKPDKTHFEKCVEMGEILAAHIEVRDNGSGMDREQLDHIFDPFYTTKEVGEGTGLGLSMVYGSMKTHNGCIDVSSERGQGTCVHIYLPIEEKVSGKSGASDQKSEAIDPGSVTLLLVDDDQAILSICSESLEAVGYRVICAGDGKDALEIFREKSSLIDVLVTDVRMPRMGGFKLAEHARMLKDDLPIIVITGYDPQRANVPEELKQNSVILTKPFAIDELKRQIRILFPENGDVRSSPLC